MCGACCPPCCCVTSCLPPGLWEPRGHTCRRPGAEIGRPGAGTCVGRGEALHVRRARGHAVSSLPCPSPPPPLFPVALKTFPQGPASCPPGEPQVFLCVEPQLTGRKLGPWWRAVLTRSLLPEAGSWLGQVGLKPNLGAWAVDHGLTGIWGDWCQSFSDVCPEAWWVPGTGTVLNTPVQPVGWGRGAASPPPWARNLSGQVVREAEAEAPGRPLAGEPPSGR